MHRPSAYRRRSPPPPQLRRRGGRRPAAVGLRPHVARHADVAPACRRRPLRRAGGRRRGAAEAGLPRLVAYGDVGGASAAGFIDKSLRRAEGRRGSPPPPLLPLCRATSPPVPADVVAAAAAAVPRPRPARHRCRRRRRGGGPTRLGGRTARRRAVSPCPRRQSSNNAGRSAAGAAACCPACAALTTSTNHHKKPSSSSSSSPHAPEGDPTTLKKTTAQKETPTADLEDVKADARRADNGTMFDEQKLISLVRSYKTLYDKGDKYYDNKQVREDIWKQIAEMMGEPEKLCKQKWKYLRESYRKALKLRCERNVDPEGRLMRPWKYENEMQFLLMYIGNRERFELFPSLLHHHHHGSRVGDRDEYGYKTEDDAASLLSAAGAVRSHTPALASAACAAAASSAMMMGAAAAQGAAAASFEDNLMVNVLGECLRARRGDLHPVDMFFRSLAEDVKQMPPLLQIRVKRDVLQCVSNAQLEAASCSESKFL